MSSRLVALTARRAALQAECALQRDDAALAYGDIEQGVAKVDRVVTAVRRLAPVLLVGGAVALLAGVTLIVYFWDTHRLGASVGVTLVFLLVAAVAGWIARERLHEKPRVLDATRTELTRDVTVLRSER